MHLPTIRSDPLDIHEGQRCANAKVELSSVPMYVAGLAMELAESETVPDGASRSSTRVVMPQTGSKL